MLGLFLLALGVVMLAVNLGYALPFGWWQYFPVPLIALGLWGLVAAEPPPGSLRRRLAAGHRPVLPDRRVRSVRTSAGAAAWPIFVIAAGLSFISATARIASAGGHHAGPASGG